MAERKTKTAAVLLFALMVVAAVALVPAAATNACTDGNCGLVAASKAFAAAPPSEKAAILQNFGKEATAAISAAAAAMPGFSRLSAGCLRECNVNVCHADAGGGEAGKKKKEDDPDCVTRCDGLCRAETEGLAFAADAYAKSPAAERKAVIEAIDKQASRPDDKVEAFATSCIADCGKFCDEEPPCVAICDNGCRSRSVSIAFSLATPAQKEAITKDIQAAKAKAGGIAGTTT